MANTATTSESQGGTIAIGSRDTAVCIIPPRNTWPSFDSLRAQHDKSYGKWPPHINLVYPFVNPDGLSRAADLIASSLQSDQASPPVSLRLDSPGVFQHKNNNIVFAQDSSPSHIASLNKLRKTVLHALGQRDNNFNHHLTIGQTEDVESDRHKFLISKISLLPSPEWVVEKLYLLVRERVEENGVVGSRMKIWGTIDISTHRLERFSPVKELYDLPRHATKNTKEALPDSEDESNAGDEFKASTLFSTPSFQYTPELFRWKPYSPPARPPKVEDMPKNLTVASYNVLAEFSHPPPQTRYPLILSNIFAASASSDVLVLQEVTDDFLSYLLKDKRVRETYPFASHGPAAEQDEVDPLPNHVNIVVLSKYGFEWNWVPLKKRFKGSLVARFPGIGKFEKDHDHKNTTTENSDKDSKDKTETEEFIPLILATVHLTCGLTDTAVISKKHEIQALLRHLTTHFERNPWVVAGDFNISTSRYTIENLGNSESIEPRTVTALAGLEGMMGDVGLVDGWHVAHLERGHVGEEEVGEDGCDEHGDVYRGEQGATFDPRRNPLARDVVGQGFNRRPQRYDRILVRSEGLLDIVGFSRFGFVTEKGQAGEEQFASDHWGVRCGLVVSPEGHTGGKKEGGARVVPVKLQRAPESMAKVEYLTAALATRGVFPTEEDVGKRRAALALLRKMLLENHDAAGDATTIGKDDKLDVPSPDADTIALEQQHGQRQQAYTSTSRPIFAEVLIPVGSYGLGAWSPSSDIDCLFIGHTSSKTFFAVASQKLRRYSISTLPSAADVKLIRRVTARTGTMLELSILGVRMDLQYCAAPLLAKHWPQCLRLPVQDPMFGLPAQTLMKIKAARDLQYVKSSVPDLKVFRLAYRAIREWARARGLYAARFGYLGGIQISVLLARVHKMLESENAEYLITSCDEGKEGATEAGVGAGGVSVPDLLTSFFTHYATFDWKSDMAFDPFFHRGRSHLRYPRSAAREPLAILGWYPPQLNTSHAGSLSSVRALSREFERARDLLRGGVSWDRFFSSGTANITIKAPLHNTDDGAIDFLKTYKSYIKIEVQYWGLSLAKGMSLLGFLESRCVSLFVDMSVRLPGIQTRIWPGRFVRADQAAEAASKTDTTDGDDEAAENENGRDYQGVYLIGLDKSTTSSQSTQQDEEKLHGTLLTVLRRFQDQIHAAEKYYDSNWSYVSVDLVRSSKLVPEGENADRARLVPDTRDWGVYQSSGDISDSEDEDEDEEDEEVAGLTNTITAGATKPKPKAEGGAGALAHRAAKPAGAGKFRTSSDVINRLRWDPELDSGDYVVGYEDRFVGVMERGLDEWKGEQTDEEFIPQHRIVYFRKKSDGVVVWDRRTRVDAVFGSG